MIIIGIPKITKNGRDINLSCEIEMNNQTKKLCLQVEKKYEKYLVTDRCDAFLIAMLPIAMRNKKDIICQAPVSEELLYNIKTQLIPALTRTGKGFYKTRVNADVCKKNVKSCGAVGVCFFSDVASMHVINDYMDSEYNSLNITHLCITDTGAFDTAGYASGNKNTEKVKADCISNIVKLSDELEIPAIVINTNLAKDFPSNYMLDYIYCNLFPIFALQKLFKACYCGASGYDTEHFNLNNCDKVSCAKFEIFLLSMLSVSNLRLISESSNLNNIEKLANIKSFSPAQKYLHVCATNSKNCNRCVKCMSTLLALDAIDSLDNFSLVFDVDYYRKNKKRYIEYLEKTHQAKYILNEPTYNVFAKKGMLASCKPKIKDSRIILEKPVHTYSLLVENLITGKILIEKNTEDYHSAVGFAKIMTAILALESGKTQLLIDVPDNIPLKVKTATLYDLINILLLTQNNAVADVIAEIVGGSVPEFVELMNNKSKELRAYNTYYSSPIGTNTQSYTTIADGLLLLKYAFKNPHYCKIFDSKFHTINSRDVQLKVAATHPLMLRQSKYYVSECVAALYGLFGHYANNIVLAEKDNQTYLAILMGTAEEGKTEHRFEDASNVIKAVL